MMPPIFFLDPPAISKMSGRQYAWYLSIPFADRVVFLCNRNGFYVLADNIRFVFSLSDNIPDMKLDISEIKVEQEASVAVFSSNIEGKVF